MLRLHIELASHLVAIIGKEIVVERLHITSYRATNARGMSGEDSTNLRQLVVDIQGTKTAHPLVSVIDHLLTAVEIMIIKALNHQCGSIREH